MKNELYEMLENIRKEVRSIYEGDATNEDGEAVNFYDYFNDVLDYEYTINCRREYVGVKVWVTLGGPNIWIDTRDGSICGAWGTERESVWLPSEIAAEIDSIFEELYNC